MPLVPAAHSTRSAACFRVTSRNAYLQEGEGNAIAARKLTVVFDLVDADQKALSRRRTGREGGRRDVRGAVEAGEGANDALADALLRAV